MLLQAKAQIYESTVLKMQSAPNLDLYDNSFMTVHTSPRRLLFRLGNLLQHGVSSTSALV